MRVRTSALSLSVRDFQTLRCDQHRCKSGGLESLPYSSPVRVIFAEAMLLVVVGMMRRHVGGGELVVYLIARDDDLL